MDRMVFAQDLTERLKITKPTLYRAVNFLKMRKRFELKKRDGRQMRRERCFTPEEAILLTEKIKIGRWGNTDVPPKRENNIYHSWHRIWQWQ
jgi:hypothetical protein